MSSYEMLMIVITIIQLIYNILSDLLRRRNKDKE